MDMNDPDDPAPGGEHEIDAYYGLKIGAGDLKMDWLPQSTFEPPIHLGEGQTVHLRLEKRHQLAKSLESPARLQFAVLREGDTIVGFEVWSLEPEKATD